MSRAKEPSTTGIPIYARRLRQARLRLGVTQQALGELVGMDVSVASPRMNQYERGRREPNLAMWEQLAAVLRVPMAYFYCEESNLAQLLADLHLLPARRRTALLNDFASQLEAEIAD